MSRVELIDFKEEHLNSTEYSRLLPYNSDTIDLSYKRTIVRESKILGIIGFWRIQDKVLYGWLLPTPLLKENGIATARLVKGWVDNMFDKFDCRRVQTISEDDKIVNRWMKFVGFDMEGTLRKYFEDKDAIIWARVK